MHELPGPQANWLALHVIDWQYSGSSSLPSSQSLSPSQTHRMGTQPVTLHENSPVEQVR
jgi:hypothetical protein